MSAPRKSIAVLMTCHNRREKTVACVASLQAAAAGIAGGYATKLFLTDDGSTDGTAEAVHAVEPGATIIRGSGNLFWNGGMREAFGAALAEGHDFYLLLNDDVTLFADSLSRLMAASESAADERTILVGSTEDGSGRITYGGVSRHYRLKRINFSLVVPENAPRAVETFNGNCVLIPAAAAARLGNLSAEFVHGIGDFDYGLRATAAGIPVMALPGAIGTCGKNETKGTYNDTSLPMRVRWRKLASDKGLPIKGWAAFCRRHTGPAWPLFAVWPYARVVLTSLKRG